jgi:hypothetical protein
VPRETQPFAQLLESWPCRALRLLLRLEVDQMLEAGVQLEPPQRNRRIQRLHRVPLVCLQLKQPIQAHRQEHDNEGEQNVGDHAVASASIAFQRAV